MTYLELVSSYIKKNGGDADLITAVNDYLENAHPQYGRPWAVGFDDICHAAVAYANAKKERLRKHKKRTAVFKANSPSAINGRHRQSLAQEAHAIRLALRQPSSRRNRHSMIKRLERLEKLISESNKRRTH
jgi:hypothetical protein